MIRRLPIAVLGLAVPLAFSAGCGRGEGYGEGFSLGGPASSTTGRPTAVGSSASGGDSGGSMGAGTSGENGASGNGAGSTSGGTGTPGGFSSGNSGTGTSGNAASGVNGTGGTTGPGGNIGTGGSAGASGSAGTGATGGAGGSGGNVSGATGGNGAGTGGASDGGPNVCDPTIQPVGLAACQINSDCGCPTICADDPFEGQVCEWPCVKTSDCPSLSTFCNGSSCQVNTCGGASGNGTLNSFCDVTGTNDGTCTPFVVPSSGAVVGICLQGGTSTGCCDPTSDRLDLQNACAAGMICMGGGLGQGAVCGNACDPFGRPTCPDGQSCALTIDAPEAGGCFGGSSPSGC